MTTSLSKEPVRSAVHAGAVEFALDVPAGTSKTVRVGLATGGQRFGADIPVDASRMSTAAWRTLAVRDGTTGAPIVDAMVTVGDSVLSNASPTGAYGFATESADVRVAAPGYRPVTVAKSDAPAVAMTPWFGGALAGKRFVLDPQGGPPLAVGVGPLGLAAAHVNLRVANYLQGFLRAAGADVRLTRTDEEVRLPEDVARMTNRFRADRYIEIRHPSAPVDSPRVLRAFFFPGSANGEAFARTIGETAASRLGVPFRGPTDTVTYALQQTACPAIVVAAPAISDADEEKRLDRAAYQREQAYAIFLGILRHYGVADTGALEVEVAGGPPAGWTVTLDGTWTLVTDEVGRVSFEYVPSGSHDVVLRRATDVLTRRVVTADIPARLQVDATH
jgi:N-acetylmuramoyl-L-alanine amidase